jgi:ADP-ribosylation factor-like protein 6
MSPKLGGAQVGNLPHFPFPFFRPWPLHNRTALAAPLMDFLRALLRSLGLLRRPARVIVVGLDNSGKSSLIASLQPSRATFEVTPTVGFAKETFARGGFTFDVWDMSGAGAYRSLWEAYYREADAVIFVVDAADRLRLCVARDELESLLAHADVAARRPPMLFFANKMDVPGAAEPRELTEDLGLRELLRDRPWQIAASNALTGEGVDDGLAWLVSALNARASDAARSGNSGGAGGGGSTRGAPPVGKAAAGASGK